MHLDPGTTAAPASRERSLRQKTAANNLQISRALQVNRTSTPVLLPGVSGTNQDPSALLVWKQQGIVVMHATAVTSEPDTSYLPICAVRLISSQPSLQDCDYGLNGPQHTADIIPSVNRSRKLEWKCCTRKSLSSSNQSPQ